MYFETFARRRSYCAVCLTSTIAKYARASNTVFILTVTSYCFIGVVLTLITKYIAVV